MDGVKFDVAKVVEAQKLLGKVEHDIGEVELLSNRIASVRFARDVPSILIEVRGLQEYIPRAEPLA